MKETMRNRAIANIFMTAAAIASTIAITTAPAHANHPGSAIPQSVPAADNQIRHIHYSMLFGNEPGEPRVTPGQLRNDLRVLAKQADLITLTEIISWERRNAVLLDGWGLCWKPGQDTGVLYRKSLFGINWCGFKKVSDTRYYSELGNRWVSPRPIAAAMLVTKPTSPDVAPKKVLVTSGHAVSCVMSRWRDGWIPPNQLCSSGRTTRNLDYIKRNPLRVRAGKDLLRGWSDWSDSLVETYQPDVVINAGDMNLDIKMGWVREYLGNVWDDEVLSWLKWNPWDYTHELNTYKPTKYIIIDGVYVGGEGVTIVRGSKAFPEMSSDHSAFVTIIGIPV